MNFFNKLEFLMARDGIKNLKVLSERSGIPYTTLKGFYSRGVESVKLSTVEKLKIFFDTSLDYLMNEDIADPHHKAGEPNRRMPQPHHPTRQVPLVGRIAARQPAAAIEYVEDWLLVDERDDVDFALRVKGDSMTGVGIYDGDIIYVRSQPTVNNGEIAVITIDDGHPEATEATCKRFYQYGKTVLLRPESHNLTHKEREITLGKGTNIQVQGKVIFLKSHIEGR